MDNKEAVTQEIASWIDTRCLAEGIVQRLEDIGEEVCLENGKRIWLKNLQLLGENIGRTDEM